MYYVSILKSKKNGKLYKGSTGDLKLRLSKHNRGEVISTKAYCPWKVIYYEAFVDRTDALIEENF